MLQQKQEATSKNHYDLFYEYCKNAHTAFILPKMHTAWNGNNGAAVARALPLINIVLHK